MSEGGVSKSKSRVAPEVYDPALAIEIERLEQKSFKQDFYEQMEQINYDRYIEQDKWRGPQFQDL